MKIIIRRIENGFIITDLSEQDEAGDTRPVISCIEIDEDEEIGHTTPRAIQKLFWKLMDLLGEFGSKYDKERVTIRLEHGDDYECKDPKCDICQERQCRCWEGKCTE